jgi:hypothetical protein
MNVLSAVNILTSQGQFDRQQAEATVKAMIELLDKTASSDDLALQKAETRAIIAEVRVSTAELKSELIRWVVSVGILQFTLISALILKLVG